MKISELPEPYKSLAIKRLEYEKEHGDEEALFGGSGDYKFCWIDTPEGKKFWNNVNDATSVADLPPYPYPTEPEHSTNLFKFC